MYGDNGRCGGRWQGLRLALAALVVWAWSGSGAVWCQPTPVAPIEPDKQAQMDEIRFTEIQDGEKKWVLVAARADYLKERDVIQLSRVQVEIFTKDGKAIKLQGDLADIYIKSRQLTVTGNVKAAAEQYSLETSRVDYLPKERQLVAPEEVRLEGPQLAVEGRRLTVDLEKKRLTLQEHTKTRWQLAGRPWKL